MSFKIFRKYQRVSLWVLVVITVCTFSLFSVSSALRTCSLAPGDMDFGDFTLGDGTTRQITFERRRETRGLLQGLRRAVGDDMVIRHIVLHEEAKRAGFKVSVKELQTYVKAMLNQFFGSNATAEQYRLAYRNYFNFLTPQAFEDALREVLLVEKLKGYYKLPDDCILTEEIYEKYKVDNEEFKVDYLTFAVADYEEEYPADGVEEKDLEECYDRIRVGMGREEYSEPERFALDFASVDLAALDFEKYAELTAETVIDDDRISDYYLQVRERFRIEEDEAAPEGDSGSDSGSEGDPEEDPEEEEKEPRYQPEEEVKDLLEKELKIVDLVDRAHSDWVDFVTENDLLEKPAPPVKKEEKEGEETPEEETPDAGAFFKELCDKYQLTHTRTKDTVSWEDLADYEVFGSEDFKARIRMQNGNAALVMKPGSDGGRLVFLARVVEKVPVKKKEFSEVRDLVIEDYLKMKRMDLAYESAKKFRESLQEKVRELEDLKPEVEKIEAEETATAEKRIEQKNKDEEFTEEAAEKLREEGKRRAKGRIERYLEKYLCRAYEEVCTEKGLKPVVIDTFSKAVARDPEALEGDSPGDKFIKKHPLITRSDKGTILRPLRAEQDSACYLVHIIDRGFPAPERMTREDVNDGIGRIRMDKMIEQWRNRQSDKPVEDDRFKIESIMTDFKVNLYREEKGGEEKTGEEKTGE